MAYYQLEPFGEDRADLRAGIVSATLVNCHTYGKAKAKAQDYMPDFSRTHQRRRMSIQEMQARMLAASGLSQVNP